MQIELNLVDPADRAKLRLGGGRNGSLLFTVVLDRVKHSIGRDRKTYKVAGSFFHNKSINTHRTTFITNAIKKAKNLPVFGLFDIK